MLIEASFLIHRLFCRTIIRDSTVYDQKIIPKVDGCLTIKTCFVSLQKKRLSRNIFRKLLATNGSLFQFRDNNIFGIKPASSAYMDVSRQYANQGRSPVPQKSATPRRAKSKNKPCKHGASGVLQLRRRSENDYLRILPSKHCRAEYALRDAKKTRFSHHHLCRDTKNDRSVINRSDHFFSQIDESTSPMGDLVLHFYFKHHRDMI